MYRALLICNSTYPDDPKGLPELNGPRRDGLILWRALCDPVVGMFREEEIELLQEGTAQEILAAAASLLGDATRDDDVLLYFSGHAKRISKDDLILCARNTQSHSSATLLSTGVPSTSLSKMIERSDAANIVIILDCCFSGSFKGGELEKGSFEELKGDGRYVLAASHPAELAGDSAKGLPSPFTRAVVQGIMSAAKADSTDSEVNLDALYTFIDSHLPQDCPRPWRGYDGSGTFVISRKHSALDPSLLKVAAREQEVLTSESQQKVPYEAMAQHQPSEFWRFTRRVTGDVSVADIRTWGLISILGIATSVSLWLAYRRWPGLYDGYDSNDNIKYSVDPHRVIAWPCLAIAILVALLSLVEGILFTRLERRAKTRREVITATHHRVITVARNIRHVISYMSAIPIIATIFGFQDYDIYWVVALSFLGLFACMSIVENMRYGDVLFFGGAALFVVSSFLPVGEYDDNFRILGSPAAVIELILGSFMLIVWWFKGPRILIIGSAAICLLPLVSVLTEGVHVELAPRVGLTGVAVCAAAWVLGAGQRIDRGKDSMFPQSPARMLVIALRAAACTPSSIGPSRRRQRRTICLHA